MPLYNAATRGTWTPALTFVTPGDLAAGSVTAWGEWILRDGWVTVNFSYVANTWTHTTASGALRVSGIPFTAKTVSGATWVGSIGSVTGITKAGYGHYGLIILSGGTTFNPQASGSGLGASGIQASEFASGSAKSMTGSISYPIA